jgi:hypothetical protein
LHALAPVGVLIAGDYGYIPDGSTNFENFVHLGNFEDSPGKDRKSKEMMEVVGKTHGTMHLRSWYWYYPTASARGHVSITRVGILAYHLAFTGNPNVFVHHEVGLTTVNDSWQLLILWAHRLGTWHPTEDVNLGESQNLPSVIRRLKTSDPIPAH